jgi:type IV pilus assembly protein PilQ
MRYIVCLFLISILSFSGFSAQKTTAPKQFPQAIAAPSPSAESKTVTEQEKAEAHFTSGYSLFFKGSYNEALAEFIKMLSYKPERLKARCWMAKTYYRMGYYRSAVSQCNAALKLDPKDDFPLNLRSLAQKKLAAKRPAMPRPTAIFNKTVAENSVQTAALPPSAEAISAASASTIEAASSQKMPVIMVKKKEPQHLISLDLRNVDISSVLQVFSKETGINVVAGQDVYGKVSVILNNVTPEDALDIILRSNGYTYTREGDMVRVFSSTEPARVEELPDGTFVRTFMIDYVDPEELLSTLTKLMPEDANIYSTKGSKGIIVKGNANDIKRAEVLIRSLDIPPREVMVEAKVVSVSLSEGQSLGMNHLWTNPDNTTEKLKSTGNVINSPDWFNPTDTSATTNPSGLYYEITNQNIQSIVEALATRTGFQVLSSPKVMALNDQKAEIKTGSQLGYNVSTVTNGVVSNTVQFLDVGTKLDITPSIKSDGLIQMEIHPEISDGLIDKVTGLPSKTSTETTTQLIVKDGQVIIIGGLIRDSVQKQVHGVPVLMDVPLIGEFFKRTELTSEKSEIIVLISPHIVNQKYTAEMEGKINEIEQMRHASPAMTLDLFR